MYFTRDKTFYESNFLSYYYSLYSAKDTVVMGGIRLRMINDIKMNIILFTNDIKMNIILNNFIFILRQIINL